MRLLLGERNLDWEKEEKIWNKSMRREQSSPYATPGQALLNNLTFKGEKMSHGLCHEGNFLQREGWGLFSSEWQ